MPGNSSTVARCTMPPSSTPPRSQSSEADHGQPFCVTVGIGASRSGAGGDADRRVVEPQHQHVALDAAGRQPVAGPRARADRDLEAAVGAADDLLAGEAVPLHRIGDQPALGIVERDGPVARLRRDAAQDHVAAAVERTARRRRRGHRTRRRRPSRPAVRRCAPSWRAHRGRCRACRSSATRSRRRS